jgi:hypothetical protein
MPHVCERCIEFKMENEEGRNHLEDLEVFFYMVPCLHLQLHVNGSKSLLQCLFIQENGRL